LYRKCPALEIILGKLGKNYKGAMEGKNTVGDSYYKKIIFPLFYNLRMGGGRGDLSFIPRKGGGGGGAEIESSVPRGLD
jgi:hypothetical protein